MSLPAASLSVRRSAIAGDRVRRRRAAARHVARWAPWVAAFCCVASALAVVIGVVRPAGVVLLGTSALVAVGLLVAARLDRPPADDVVAELDEAALLGGSLRSAHWFARHDPHATAADADTAWVTFHVEAAAARAEAVDWSAAYPRTSAARRWLATAALAAATVALLRFDPPGLSSVFGSVPDDPGDTLIVIPSHLAGQVVEGMKAMRAGTQPSKEALTAVGQALEIAKEDPRARRELERLFAQAGGEFMGGYGDEWGRNEMDEGTPPPEWAYEDAVSRASLQTDAPADRAESSGSSAEETGRGAKAGEIGRGAAVTRPDAAVVRADTRGQAGSFSSLLFGRAQARDDAAAPPARGVTAPANAALAAALRREVVHARTDIPDASRVASRPAPDRRSAALFAPGVAPTGLRYEASSAGRPPAVPDARRSVVHGFFARPADPTPVAPQP